MHDLDQTKQQNTKAAVAAARKRAIELNNPRISNGCAKHPDYKGVRPPRSACPVCARIWRANNS